MLETAAKLIKSDIMTNVPPVNEYPTTDILKLQNALDYIPKSLHIVLKALFVVMRQSRKLLALATQLYKQL